MARDTGYKDLLDYTVSYKTVWSIFGVAVAVAVAGWFAWQRFKPAGADEQARQIIKEATRLESRAGGCVQESTPAEFLNDLQAGKAQLVEARSRFEAGEFEGAANVAEQARDGLREFNDQVCASVESVARFIEMKGQIKIKTAKSARWVNASRGTRLLPGDRIRADAGEARIEYKNGEKYTIKKDTVIQIQSYQLKPGGGATADTIFEGGELVAEGVTNGDSVISTGFGEARPRDGDISLKTGKDGKDLRVRSERGRSTFESGGVTRRMNEISKLDAIKAQDGSISLGDVRRDLLGPELRDPIDGRHFVVEDPGSELTGFEWRPAEGAERYIFQIGRNDWFEPVLNDGDERVPQGRVDIIEAAEIRGLPPGTYFWRVAGVTGDGDFGRWSQASRFTISQGTQSDEGREPPALEVDKGIAIGDKYIFKGKCDAYARLQVFVNGKRWQDVDLDDDGGFSIMVPVEHDGWNTITFEAQDTYGTKNPIDRKVYWSGI
jgi:hypothetical protein